MCVRREDSALVGLGLTGIRVLLVVFARKPGLEETSFRPENMFLCMTDGGPIRTAGRNKVYLFINVLF